MIIPVNNHLVIEPVAHESFMSTGRETFEEIGIVVALPNDDEFEEGYDSPDVDVGDRVYFDSWLAAKYPNGADGYYWLVKWDDVRAIEKHGKVSAQ